MSATAASATASFERRRVPGAALAEQAEVVARACYAMAQRFHAGGTLYVFGTGSSATDAAHVAVEFVHPVLVGKRALPAASLGSDVAGLTAVARDSGFDDIFAAQLRLHAHPQDIALAISVTGRCPAVVAGLECARERGLLTIALLGETAAPLPVDHLLRLPADDALLVKELQVTTYHVLWELVHVFFDQPGLLDAAVR